VEAVEAVEACFTSTAFTVLAFLYIAAAFRLALKHSIGFTLENLAGSSVIACEDNPAVVAEKILISMFTAFALTIRIMVELRLKAYASPNTLLCVILKGRGGFPFF